ncbi:MAG TPA: DUF3616 domain-containing protein, partial [Longimicrobium sp.]|nr:DUF3616 domain-containing protein [Longimicrobium sp.]
RWEGAQKLEADSITGRGQLQHLLDLPHDVEGGEDHPEGICCLQNDGSSQTEVLVVYDSGGPGRQDGNAVVADVFRIAGERGAGVLATLFPRGGHGDGEDRDGDRGEE